MSANSFGHLFKITTFGESHGIGLGVVVEGCPAGLKFDTELLISNLKKRKPGQSHITTSRQELDEPEVLSGVYNDITLGTPICILVRNRDQRSEDYDQIKNEPRVGHADDIWKIKFGHIDHRGGGRSSGRETLCRVMAGSIAQMLCLQLLPELKMKVYVNQIADYKLQDEEKVNIWNQDVEMYTTRFPSNTHQAAVANLLEEAVKNGESYGGSVEVKIRNLKPGLGQPVFHKLKADLTAAMMGIGATTAVEFGGGFESLKFKGTEFHTVNTSSQYGGIRGGISTGDEMTYRAIFKPTSSIKEIAKKGRHDPCIVVRAVPVVEAMSWLVLADHLLWSRIDRL